MKRCPACNRTYTDETLTFCLEDGSVLSASYDPNETLQIPAARDTDSILTRVSHHKAEPTNPSQPLMPTMPSPQIPPAYFEKPQYQTARKRPDNKFWIAVGSLVCMAAFMAAAIVWVNRGETPTNSNFVVNNQNVGTPNSNKLPRNDNKDDTLFGPMDDHASLIGENLTYYPGTNAEQCQADCARNPRCKGFTFIRAGAYNPQDSAMCYLASYVKESVSHACCISAVKR